MDIQIKYDCTDINWQVVTKTLKDVGMAYFDNDTHQKAFENSYVTVFIYTDNQLIGFGRALSDGAYQAAIYDVAVIPEYQGMGLGKTLMDALMEKLSGCNVILYAAPGKENFYAKQKFRKMKTGMAAFINANAMKEKGFTI
ncbi:GNAT family N-acetyltransferase [Maridesulfovibrio zosterae]|uniref:GNAT family N-acetyltransferase n=1 Tax=Maridesulfovibrio zosterae TaxID=82171 RepID=UPI00041FC5CF|nr:GNAT family N-acetyltransferase [Maridesulfovibrio zosterae]